MSVIETARLRLRDVRAADEDVVVAQFAEASAHDSILRRQRDPATISSWVRSAAAYAARYDMKEREHLHLVAERREDGAVIGSCTLTNAIRGGDARLGWHFGEAFSGRGFATEALDALLTVAIDRIGVRRVYGDCFASNDRSVRIFGKLGMAPVAASAWLRWRLALRYRERRPVMRFATRPR